MDYPEKQFHHWDLTKLISERVFAVKFLASAIRESPDGIEVHIQNHDASKAIRLAGPCSLEFEGTEPIFFDLTSAQPKAIQPLLLLLGQYIWSASIREDGILTIGFSGQMTLHAYPANFESWELFDHRYMYSIPGGGVGIAKDTLRVGPGAYEWRLLHESREDYENKKGSQ